jgi:uncharacterized protein YjbI with pentapeptide repeats
MPPLPRRAGIAYEWVMGLVRLCPKVLCTCVLIGCAGPALADCSDVAQPEVYWRRCVQDGQNLQEANLAGAVLRDGSFKRADLSGADLSGADARRAKFVSTVLHGTILDGAKLVRADLTNADLRDASLKQADLTGAKLFRANLRGADLSGARLDDADLLKAELGGALWVDGKTVCSESSIGQCQPSPEQRAVSDVEPSG